jgi:tRNA-binding protein
MSKEIKSKVKKEETFDLLEIRLGRVLAVEIEPSAPKCAYKLTIDFGKFGKKVSVGRFTKHSIDELKGRLVLAVLNFEPKYIGDVNSEVLVLGVQYPGAESGEATYISPATNAKIGGKLF